MSKKGGSGCKKAVKIKFYNNYMNISFIRGDCNTSAVFMDTSLYPESMNVLQISYFSSSCGFRAESNSSSSLGILKASFLSSLSDLIFLFMSLQSVCNSRI